MSTTSNPEGYKVEAVEAWISNNIPELSPPFEWTRLEGGHSNLTYMLKDQTGKQAVIRRPPQGELLPKAHDMSREWALISSLNPTSVPVPAAYGFCESPDVTGAWFYVMGAIDGKPLYSADDARALIPESEREALCHSFIDVLADLSNMQSTMIPGPTISRNFSSTICRTRVWPGLSTATMDFTTA